MVICQLYAAQCFQHVIHKSPVYIVVDVCFGTYRVPFVFIPQSKLLVCADATKQAMRGPKSSGVEVSKEPLSASPGGGFELREKRPTSPQGGDGVMVEVCLSEERSLCQLRGVRMCVLLDGI